jgi:hypothetical protein
MTADGAPAARPRARLRPCRASDSAVLPDPGPPDAVTGAGERGLAGCQGPCFRRAWRLR